MTYYGQTISGTHEHIWTGSYGYAEPLEQMGMEQYWLYFCGKANIIGNHAFSTPDFDALTGQGRLL